MKTLTPAARAFKAYKADTAQTIKDRIQGLLRAIVIIRDDGCVLSRYQEITGSCGGFRKDGGLILQAEHLNSRARNISYGDLRNLVCLCQRHHFYWKPQNSSKYWEIIEDVVGPERWEYYRRVRDDNRTYPMSKSDWQLVEISLKKELQKIQNG